MKHVCATEVMERLEEELLSGFKGFHFYENIGNMRYCPTGEPYQTVTSAGIKIEGDLVELFKTSREAIEEWGKTIKKITNSAKRKSIVFWRRLPELLYSKPVDGDDGWGILPSDGGWTVYSRFRISAQPIIQDADYNKAKKGK